jgi:membrane protein DedA with SNARE-associated domain
MTDSIMALVEQHGAIILFLTTLLASMAMPVPASFTLLAAGALTATGGLSLPVAGAAALAGAIIGDMTAYAVGRWGGAALWDRMQGRPRVGRMMTEASEMLHNHAAMAVLLSRWPFSPVGPYVNAVSGATRLPPLRFVALCALGDTIWISLYMGLGHVFAARFKDVGHLLSLAVACLAFAVVLAILLRWARRAAK